MSSTRTASPARGTVGSRRPSHAPTKASQARAISQWKQPRMGVRGNPLIDLDSVLERVRERPGEWLAVAQGVSRSYAYNSAVCQALKRDHGCQITVCHADGDQKGTGPRYLFVKYLGPNLQPSLKD